MITIRAGSRFLGWTRQRGRQRKGSWSTLREKTEKFYRGLAESALIGMESTGNCQWFVEMATLAGHEVWIGDAAKIRASEVRQQKHDRRDAALILKLIAFSGSEPVPSVN